MTSDSLCERLAAQGLRKRLRRGLAVKVGRGLVTLLAHQRGDIVNRHLVTHECLGHVKAAKRRLVVFGLCNRVERDLGAVALLAHQGKHIVELHLVTSDRLCQRLAAQGLRKRLSNRLAVKVGRRSVAQLAYHGHHIVEGELVLGHRLRQVLALERGLEARRANDVVKGDLGRVALLANERQKVVEVQLLGRSRLREGRDNAVAAVGEQGDIRLLVRLAVKGGLALLCYLAHHRVRIVLSKTYLG